MVNGAAGTGTPDEAAAAYGLSPPPTVPPGRPPQERPGRTGPRVTRPNHRSPAGPRGLGGTFVVAPI
ncbi:hypothetical protein GCM10022384_30020 [Streptomyces marokkonensis]|uniref:Uncharacterized protein n=1 Tax=Streptomyces marokkonensis TaxID=324855 RepID=A0ABP7Q8G5_9ACTN